VATNNVAEYQGLIRALKQAVEFKADDVRIYSDSELMVKQITGDYRVKSADLQPLHEEAQSLLLKLGSWQIRHVRREDNKRADQLVNLALDTQSDVTGNGDKVEDAASENQASGDDAAPNDLNIPRWHATIVGPKGGCPMGCAVNRKFVFGPQMPKGFCVHAGQAMYMTDPFSLLESVETSCGHCGLLIRVDL